MEFKLDLAESVDMDEDMEFKLDPTESVEQSLRPTPAVHTKFIPKHYFAMFYIVDCNACRIVFEYEYMNKPLEIVSHGVALWLRDPLTPSF